MKYEECVVECSSVQQWTLKAPIVSVLISSYPLVLPDHCKLSVRILPDLCCMLACSCPTGLIVLEQRHSKHKVLGWILTSLGAGRDGHLQQVGLVHPHVGQGDPILVGYLLHQPFKLVGNFSLLDIKMLVWTNRQVFHWIGSWN